MNKNNELIEYISKLRPYIVFGLVLLMITLVLGNFMKVYQTDESFFMYKAWSVTYFDDTIISAYLPGLFPFVFSKFVGFFDGDMDVFIYSRAIVGMFFIASIVLIYIYVHRSFSNIKRSSAFLLSALAIIYVAAMRGFELRPESIANLFLIASFSYLILSSARFDKILFYVSLFLAMAAAFTSLRYTLPAAFIALASCIKLWHKDDFKYIDILYISISILIFVSFIHFYVHDYSVFIKALTSYESTREFKADLYSKVFSLGLGKYDYVFNAKGLYFSEYVRVITFLMFSALMSLSIARAGDLKEKLLLSTLFSGGMSIYLFTLMESIPMNYVVSLEVIYVFLSLVYVCGSLGFYDNKKYILLSLSPILLGGVYSFVFLERHSILDYMFIKTKSTVQIKSLSDEELLYHKRAPRGEYNLESLSMIYNEACARYSGYKVFTKEFGYHPICIRDEYSHQYWLELMTYEEVLKKINESSSDIKFIGDHFVFYR
ncbi:hypothetical protein IX92_15250 [Vibrio coralliilyticus]|uniref:Uncharacterized protein n=2 Tax=Vibrio coralliilyticus TaxID=190893 RepID=A0AAN0SFG7_9VIBR|nr:hypothetical protein IX92_15250 [Vibrio coralliilyticus]